MQEVWACTPEAVSSHFGKEKKSQTGEEKDKEGWREEGVSKCKVHLHCIITPGMHWYIWKGVYPRVDFTSKSSLEKISVCTYLIHMHGLPLALNQSTCVNVSSNANQRCSHHARRTLTRHMVPFLQAPAAVTTSWLKHQLIPNIIPYAISPDLR